MVEVAAPAIRVGTAGWTLPREHQAAFPAGASHLARYATRLPVAEINSCFYRSHRASTWQRWREQVPPGFRFSAKLPRTVTHERKLADAAEPLEAFLAESAGLGDTLALLLVQLPPSLAFDPGVAAGFFTLLRARTALRVACEPRHPSWFEAEADALLSGHQVARVAADPARVPAAGAPGGWPGLRYYRLHGSPRMYYSSYPAGFLAALAERLRADAAAGAEVWCIFDNTASGAALGDALRLEAELERGASACGAAAAYTPLPGR